MFTSAKNFGISVCLLVLASLSSIHFAEAAASAIHGAPTFFDVTPEVATPLVHTPLALNNLFTKGAGPYDPSMEGKIYPYPLTKGGVFGADQYNGCYDRKNKRLGDLDPDNSCTTFMNANPTTAVYRLFLGYKISCPGTFSGGTCFDAQLVMNCALEQVQAGDGPFDSTAVTTRNCSNEKGITRHAQGSSNSAPAFAGCYPGQKGDTYPTCNSCDPGTYNSTIGVNTVPCTPCNGTATVPNSDLAFPPTFTTAGSGAVDIAQCRVTGVLKCATGYSAASDGQSCTLNAASCTLKISLAPKNPTGSTSDGEIVAIHSGEQGPVTNFVMTVPSAISPSATGANSKGWTGLGPNTYTIAATDDVCTQQATVTLAALPLPSPVPAPSVAPCALQITLSGANPSSSAMPYDGTYTGSILGAVGPLSVSVQSAHSVPSSNPPVSGNTATVTASALPAGSYLVSVVDNGPSPACVASASITLMAPTIITGPSPVPPGPAKLVFNVHTPADCTALGGVVYDDTSGGSSAPFCRMSMDIPDSCGFSNTSFSDGTTGPTLSSIKADGTPGCSRYFIQAWTSCPTGWTKYKKWSAWSLNRKYVGNHFADHHYGPYLSQSGGPQSPLCGPGWHTNPNEVCAYTYDAVTLPFADYSLNSTCTALNGYWNCTNGYPQYMMTSSFNWVAATDVVPYSGTGSCQPGYILYPANTPYPGSPSGPPFPYCFGYKAKNNNPDMIPASQAGQWRVPVSTEVGCY